MSPSPLPTVVGIGELLWDCFSDGRRPGGAPANVAFHADQLGCRGVILSRVGDDVEGSELREELERNGIDTSAIQIDPRLPTGRVTVNTSDPQRPSYHIHRDVAWDALAFDDAVERLLDGAAAVCVGSLAQRCESSRTTIQRCLDRAAGALRVYDVNLRPDGYDRDGIEATLGRTDVVKLNVEEVAVLGEIWSIDGSDPEVFARWLIDRHGLELVCVTRAEHGCLLVSATESVDSPGRAVEEADAVGAGDAFTAALILARLRGWSLERTARVANDVGALVAGSRGAMPPLRDVFADRLASISPGT